MTEVIGVRFREEGKIYYFDPRGIKVVSGADVIVETSRGIEYGVCASSNEMIEDNMVVQPLRPMLRLATDEDRRQVEENKKKEADAFVICEKKILEHGLDMKLVEVEYTLDGSKILFFFTSEGRVDFRELVKELASVFRARIELRQIGVRDEAKMLGGLGICGRPFCCATFMDEFQPVSIKMAKTQNLSLNPTKISGTCGRLMCCLKYEQEAYEYLIANSIKLDSYVKTPDGKGTVVDVNLFKGLVKVRLDSENDNSNIKTYKSDDLFVMRSGKKGQMPPEPEDMPKAEPEPIVEEDEDETPSWLKSIKTPAIEPKIEEPTLEPEIKEKEAKPQQPRRKKKSEHAPKQKEAKPAKPQSAKENAVKEHQAKEHSSKDANRASKPRANAPQKEEKPKPSKYRKGPKPQDKAAKPAAEKPPVKKAEPKASEKAAAPEQNASQKSHNPKNKNHRYHHNRRSQPRQGKGGEGKKSE
ncbi:MAG: hypothetical protein IKM51_05815 [Oscillospiraceae bacterium]|nr:hypothetical protein [Oscillospiraceae bacterium]